MLAAAAAGGLPDYVSNIFRSDDSQHERLVRDAVAAHRTGEMDLVAAFAHADEEHLSYGCQQFLEEALPKLQWSQAQVLELVTGLAERSNGSELPYYLSDWFSGWCETKSARPWDMLEAIESGVAPEYLKHSVLHSGLKVNRRKFLPALIDRLNNGSSDEKWISGSLLGRFTGYNEKDRPDL